MKRLVHTRILSSTSVDDVTRMQELVEHKNIMGIFRLCEDKDTSYDALVYAINSGNAADVLYSPNLNEDLLNRCIDSFYTYANGKVAIIDLMTACYNAHMIDNQLEDIAKDALVDYMSKASKLDIKRGAEYFKEKSYPDYFDSDLKPIVDKFSKASTKRSTRKLQYSCEEIGESIEYAAPSIADELFEMGSSKMDKESFIDFLEYQIESYPDELEFDSADEEQDWIDYILSQSVFSK